MPDAPSSLLTSLLAIATSYSIISVHASQFLALSFTIIITMTHFIILWSPTKLVMDLDRILKDLTEKCRVIEDFMVFEGKGVEAVRLKKTLMTCGMPTDVLF